MINQLSHHIKEQVIDLTKSWSIGDPCWENLLYTSHCSKVSVVCMVVTLCIPVVSCRPLAVMARLVTEETVEADALLDLFPVQQGNRLRFTGLRGLSGSARGRVARSEMRAVGIEKISVCCRRHGSWARSPDPHPIAQFPYPQSAMDRWFGEGGGAQPVCSAPQQPALLGLHWGLLLVIIEGLPWQEAGITGLHTTTDVWPATPILQFCSRLISWAIPPCFVWTH